MSKTIERSCVVPCGLEQVYNEWFQYIWIGGAGYGKPKFIEEGDPETFQGSTRDVGFGILEKILSVEPYTKIEYDVFGTWPVSYQRGTVTFTTTEDGSSTKVLWRADFTPNCCCGCLVSTVIQSAFKTMLRNFQKKLEA